MHETIGEELARVEVATLQPSRRGGRRLTTSLTLPLSSREALKRLAKRDRCTTGAMVQRLVEEELRRRGLA